VKEKYGTGAEAISHLMESKLIEERIFLEKRLIVLASLGNNAPFIGLLGTVLGIIKAFFNLGALGNSGAEVVMKSISTALVATASGLLIAIPVVIANNYFNKRLKVIMQNLEQLSKYTLASYYVKRGGN
jgi:biopolymer transport protein ExbB